MVFYDNEKLRPNSPKVPRPFNVLSVDGPGSQFTDILLHRLRQECPKLLRDTDLLVGSLQILAAAVSGSLEVDVPTSDVLLTEQLKDLQLGDLSKRIVLINTRKETYQLFSTFRDPDISLAYLFAETTGNFVENNPSMIGLAYAIDPRFGKAFLDEVRVLSLGLTGRGSIDLIQYQGEQLLNRQFHRAGPCVDLTDTVENLMQVSHDYDLSGTVDWLKEYWK